jgi:hypothetical protein
MIVCWKQELQKPGLEEDARRLLLNLIKSAEENLDYTYSCATFGSHTLVVKHKRSEPRPLVWEEKQFTYLHRQWRKFTIWLDWYLNK